MSAWRRRFAESVDVESHAMNRPSIPPIRPSTNQPILKPTLMGVGSSSGSEGVAKKEKAPFSRKVGCCWFWLGC